jgi:hypothetical protein
MAKHSNKILAALESEEKQIWEVIASQQAQEKKFNALFEQLGKLEQAVSVGGSDTSTQEAQELVRQFATELNIERSEVREAVEEMSSVGAELGGIIDALSGLDAQVMRLAVLLCSQLFSQPLLCDHLSFRFTWWAGRLTRWAGRLTRWARRLTRRWTF